jgi:hypothetical protein
MTDKEKKMFDVLAEVADERNREHLDSLDPDKELTPEELQDKKDYLDDISFENRRDREV